MADFSTLIATLQATIKTNYNQEITGQILQDDLLAIVDAVNRLKQDTLEGYAFYGEPLTDGESVSVTQNTFFLVGPGTYTINGSTNTISDAGISVIVYDSVNDEITIYPLFVYDTTPTEDSLNPVTSGGIFDAIERAVDGLANIIGTKQPKDTDAVAGNVAVMDASGSSVDGGVALTDLATQDDLEAVEQEVAQIAGEAGLAEAVIDTDGAGTEQEFTFRKSGGDGGAYYRKIKGKTLAWNQIISNGNFVNNTTTGWNFTGAASGSFSNRVLTISGISGGIYFFEIKTIFGGHKYLIRLKAGYTNIAGAPTSSMLVFGGNITQTLIGGVPCDGVLREYKQIVTANNNNSYFGFSTYPVTAGQGLLIDCDYGVNVFDLTLMFGAGNEPSTVAEFEALYPGYYPNNPGTLISNDAEAVETTGVNLLDTRSNEDSEQYIGHYYINSNGTMSSNGGYNAFRIKVFPGSDYYLKNSSGTVLSTNAILRLEDSNENLIGVNTALYNSTGGIVTTPTSCAYIVLSVPVNRNDEIQFNLSNPAINGQYFPYWKRTLQLGITTRKDTDGNVPFLNGLQSCPVAQDEATKEGGTIRVGTRAYQAGDESDADVITDGTNTNYELATPVPFTWAEPLNLGVKVDENGTERAVAPEGATAPSAPFVADTTYTMSVARMVEKLQNI